MEYFDHQVNVIMLCISNIAIILSGLYVSQATRSVLQSRESVQQMLVDWKQLDLTSITYQSVSTFQQDAQKYIDLYVECKFSSCNAIAIVIAAHLHCCL